MAGLAGSLERSIMDVLWAAPGPLRVRELLARLNENADKALAYNTVQTVAERLAQKGMLQRTQDGLAFRYSPTRAREEYAVELMLDVLTDAPDHGAILARFAESVPPEDARRLLEVLRRRASDDRD
ncbi:BlaI/MecI/CopY family transcriptional regulator [Actinomadura montaniterrae]|uniref:BlaI/MecI/CopY family transcriptional regulator n=1 Tax=Actinomadura montaniterrae TaxID=1803903 RepID=A0A6L3W4F0_9ACTN|nr:BlaI/MecI/CopY family transcriptional regulator [Actinomadura montaniterrae]KAB2384479.1 BlaI/MecI/CopY family transcriptional regulator [Actinomadura montaniterrae]